MRLNALILTAGILLLVGCSGIGTDPTTPNTGLSPRQLLGAWTLNFDLDAGTINVSSYSVANSGTNKSDYIPLPVFQFVSYDAETGVVEFNVSIRNTLSYNCYDSRLIVYGNDGQELVNSDGMTGFFDIPGGPEINKFLAVGKTDSTRSFSGSADHSETVRVCINEDIPTLITAFEACLDGHCVEPYSIGYVNQDVFVAGVDSEMLLWVDVLDWQNDIGSVWLECSELCSEIMANFVRTGPQTFSITLDNLGGLAPGVYEGRIGAISNGATIFREFSVTISAEEPTCGLLRNSPGAYNGYTLFQADPSPDIYLIDINGNMVHKWETDKTASGAIYLLENGNVLATCLEKILPPRARTGFVREYDWDGNIVWEYHLPENIYHQHHDIERLPNGNTMIVVWEKKTMEESIEAGRNPDDVTEDGIWPTCILEVNHAGEIVWSWHAWDHLSSETGGVANGEPVSSDITDPGKIDINQILRPQKDWLHTNSVDYNPELDQIIISAHHISEVLVVDHSTADYDDPQAGIDAAAGPAGDILYRWGNPRIYGAGTAEDQQLYKQHDAQWIEPGCPGAGNILIFNNGNDRQPFGYSSIEEIVPPVDAFGNYTMPSPGEAFAPDATVWTYSYDPPEDFFSDHISGMTRMPNGNTLICSGADGWLFEVDPSGTVLWEYINPVGVDGPVEQGTEVIERNSVFRCYRYPADFPAFEGRDLSPKGPIELY